MNADRAPWLRLGWRNLGRNGRRTAITAGGLALGYFSVVVMTGLGRGMIAEMIGNGTSILTGQLQVHAPGYLPERSVYETIGGSDGVDVDALINAVTAEPAVLAASPRVFGGGLVASGEHTVAASLIGVDPRREPEVSLIFDTGETGRRLHPGANELWIGHEMARQLDVEAGDDVVIVAPAADGSLGNDIFTVAGVFRSGIPDLDATLGFVPIDALRALIALEAGRVHEVAARVRNPWNAPAAAARLADPLGATFAGAEVRNWTVFQPQMAQYATLMRSMEWVLLIIVFIMAVFGVANTMLMATFERRREFAILRALGATPGVVLKSVLWEAVVLAAASLVLGTIFTFPILVWWHEAPPDMSWLFGTFTMAGGLVRPLLRVEYPPGMMVTAAGALFITALVAAVVPAVRAGHVPPADTLQGR